MNLFWDKVTKTDTCWLWAAFKDKNGYGRLTIRNKQYLAHRVSWELCNEKIPKGLLVCHHCDNPPCVNPDHLFLGTKKDNAQDMVRKGRCHSNHAVGVTQHLAKLTDDKALQIRELYEEGGCTHRSLGRIFGVNKTTISQVLNRQTWKHI